MAVDQRPTFNHAALIGTLAVLIFGSTMVFAYQNPVWEKWFHKAHPKPVTDLDTKLLGMSPSEIRKFHDQLVIRTDTYGRKTGTYTGADGARTVWFMAPEHGEHAFRLRFDKLAPFNTSEDMHKYLSRQFGRPNGSTCAKGSITSMKTCLYQWLLLDGIEVNAVATFASPQNDSKIQLSLTAIDTRLEGKRLRSARNGLPTHTVQR